MAMKLRDLIRKVRACKTASEERAVIAKESAMIRTAIREEQEHYRHRNVAKLLFMHMLGYPTHFGQLECMKLQASPHFPEKRIGYLGMLLLLSEEADVLMLATNSLKNDLNSDNKFVAGLALCAIGNLATADMSRDLTPEVDKHLKSSLPYLRKKACLAFVRCLAKCPDMVEDFVDRVITLLKDKSHGVLITVVQLMTQVLMIDTKNAYEEGEDPLQTTCRLAFLKLVPTLVKMLRNLLNTGYSPDHDVSGISDPFLQVQILTLLRLLGAQNAKASEEMNDVLAQVATNTETSKNAGNAILYECVQTIMGVQSEDGLRVLAVNILGRFLLNRDNNIRYVALNTLARCIVEQKQQANEEGNQLADAAAADENSAFSALQRHRQTVVDCLKDPDNSIRQRALELIYHLVNHENVTSLTSELLNYLVLCPREHRGDICTRILRVVENFSPNDIWRVDTLVTMLTIAGREASRDVQSASVVYITRSSADIHAYAAHKLLKAIRDDDGSQRGLLVVGIWCIGEYGDLLLQPYTSTTPSMNSNEEPVTVTFMALTPTTVVDTVQEVFQRLSCPEEVKQRALTCFVKLCDRYANAGDSVALERLQALVKKHEKSHSLELQIRACEYTALLNATKGIATPKKSSQPASSDSENKEEDLFGMSAENNGDSNNTTVVTPAVMNAAKEALARMPVVDLKVLQRRQAQESFGADSSVMSGDVGSSAPAAVAPKSSGGGDLLDLDDMFGGGAAAPAPATQQQQNGGLSGAAKPPAAADPDAGKSDMDLLADIFAAQATTTTSASADPFAAPAVNTSSLGMDPFGASAAPAAPVNPLDLFGSTMPSSTPSQAPMDIFGNTAATPAAVAAPPLASTTSTTMASNNMFGATPAAVPTGADAAPAPVIIEGPAFNGLSIIFECNKPDIWNKQKSELVAKFKNTNDAPIHGFNLQVAVPKYVTLEQMEPPSSTTIPQTPPIGADTSKLIFQKIKVTNSMLGTKNLMLKLKVSFTLKGNKLENMSTQSGFPAGLY